MGSEDNSSENWLFDSPDSNTLRILIATDNHLGHHEDDEITGNDSFEAFDEILGYGKKYNADCVLLGGDLFDLSKPSRSTITRAIEIFRKHCLGQRDVFIDVEGSFNGKNTTVNFEDPNISVDLPVFMIHGNHDDPIREGTNVKAVSAIDILAKSGLVNYFGVLDDLEHAVVEPIRISKGSAKLSLYGVGWVRDERMNRMLEHGKISFQPPSEESESEKAFNILMLHQNRDTKYRGVKNCFPNEKIPSFINLAIFGHEHACHIEPKQNERGCENTYLSQPGSSVVTSYSADESIPKKIMMIEIVNDAENGPHFRSQTIILQSPRSFQYQEVSLQDALTNGELKPDIQDSHDQQQEEAICYYLGELVKEMIRKGRDEYKGRNPNASQHTRPLIRVRVEHTGFTTVNIQRFGTAFSTVAANASSMLSFFKRRKYKTSRNIAEANGDHMDALEDNEEDYNMSSERIHERIMELVRTNIEHSKKGLKILYPTHLEKAIENWIDKDANHAIQSYVNGVVDKVAANMMRMVDISGKENCTEISEKIEIYAKQNHQLLASDNGPRVPISRAAPTTTPSTAVVLVEDDSPPANRGVKRGKRRSSGNTAKRSHKEDLQTASHGLNITL